MKHLLIHLDVDFLAGEGPSHFPGLALHWNGLFQLIFNNLVQEFLIFTI